MYDYITSLKLDGAPLVHDVECELEAQIEDADGTAYPFLTVTGVRMGDKWICLKRKDVWGAIARYIRDVAQEDKELFETVAAHDGWFLRADGEWSRPDYRTAAE